MIETIDSVYILGRGVVEEGMPRLVSPVGRFTAPEE